MAQPLEQFEGKYEILAKIGEGGMGAVYKVRHRLLDEVRVIKVMRHQVEDKEDVQERFTREARIAVKLRHPNIAQMHDFAIDEAGTAFIVMEYVDGITLETMLKQAGTPELGLTLEIAQQALQALFHLHKKGIVHRDISPDNLMLAREDMDEPRIKLIDLGIAKTVAGGQNLTATGIFLGKIRYASPEQFSSQGDAPIDHRADLYSFAVVLYELLTGVHPVKGESFSRLIAGHLFEPPLDFDISDPDRTVPEQLRKVVLKALAKPVEDRFEDANSFRSHLLSLQKAHPWSTEALDHALAPAAVEKLERAPRPGSTQDRINRQFLGAAATPPPLESVAPVRGKTGATEVRPVSADQTQVDALVAAAGHLAELDLWQEAKLQLGSALKLQPDHSGALRLMAEIEEAETRAKEVAEAVSVAEGLIEKGDLEEAERHLAMALERLAGATELEGIQEWIHQLQRERREAELHKLLEEAVAATQVGKHRRAVEHLEEAVKLDPGDAEAGRRLESARAAVAHQEEEELRAAVVSTALKEAEELLASERFDDAKARLEAALGEVGEVEALRKIEGRIDAAETTWRKAAVAAFVERGESLLGAGKLSEAIEAFEEGLRLQPEDGAATSGLARAREVMDEQRTQEAKEKAIAEVVAVVENLIEKGDLDKAEVHVKTALGPFAGATEIEEIQKRIHTLQREAKLRTLLEEAATATDQGEHRRALEKLEMAIELHPGDTEAGRRLESARAALAHQEEEELRAAVVSTALKEAEELLASERFDDAKARLEAALGEVGEVEALRKIEGRIDAAEATWRKAAVAAFVERGESLLGAGKLSEAIEAFEEGLQLQPDDGAATSGLARAREVMDQQRTQEAKEKVIAEVVAVVENLIEKGDLDKAEVHVKTALGPLAGATEIEGIQKRIHTLQREAKLRTLLEEAATAADQGEHRRAVEKLEMAIDLYPGDLEAGRRLEFARSTLAHQEEEERKAAVVSAALKEVEKLLASERFDDARERLDATVDEVGEVEALVDARGRVVAAEAAWRQAEVAALVQRGETLLEAGDPSEAINAFEEGLRLQPGDSAAKEALARARNIIDELRAREAKEKAIAEAVDDVESTLARGKLDTAGKRLAKARDEFGEDQRLLALARKLRGAEAALELAKLVATLVREAEKASARKDFSSAVATLEQAADLEPTNGTVQAHLAKARERLRETTAKAEAEARAIEAPPSDKTRPLELAELSGQVTDRTIVLPAAQEMATVEEKAVQEDDAQEGVKLGPAPADYPLPPGTARSARIEGRPVGSRRKWVAGTVVVLAALTLSAGVFLRWIPVPFLGGDADHAAGGLTQGTLVINALPWARIVEVTDRDGEKVDLRGAEYTPFALPLAPGSYRIVLRNDEFGDKTVLATIEAGETTTELIPFAEIDQDQLLRSLRLIQ